MGPIGMLGMEELWRTGEAWNVLLDTGRPGGIGASRGGQQGWMRRWHSHDDDAVNGSGRQRGKTFTKYAMLDEHMRKWPGSKTRFCALTIDSANAILAGAMGNEEAKFSDGYLASCPTNLKPYRDGYDWVYPGGSRLIVMGTDATTFRRGRGFSKIEREVRDEFCLYQDLDAVEAALNAGQMVPGLSGKPGRCWRASTPAESSAHPSKKLVDAAIAAGRYEIETLYDNPRVDPEVTIRKECIRLGMTREELLASTYWRREFLGLWVTEETRAAIPSWAEVALECTLEYPRPLHFDGYSAHDWGGQTADPHAALWGFYDFGTGKLIIEREHEKRGGDSKELSNEWKAIDAEQWGDREWDGTLFGAGEFDKTVKGLPEFLKKAISDRAPRQPYLRVCDPNAQQLQADMIKLYGYALMPSENHDKHLAVDQAVVMVREKRVIINPKCKRLLEQLATVLWDLKRRTWVRTEKDHGDLIDTLVFMIRNIRWHRDPRPPPSIRSDQPSLPPKPNALANLFTRRAR